MWGHFLKGQDDLLQSDLNSAKEMNSKKTSIDQWSNPILALSKVQRNDNFLKNMVNMVKILVSVKICQV